MFFFCLNENSFEYLMGRNGIELKISLEEILQRHLGGIWEKRFRGEFFDFKKEIGEGEKDELALMEWFRTECDWFVLEDNQ